MKIRNIFVAAVALITSLQLSAQVDPDSVTIIRDNWGVPHIYATTNAGAAYGLAWAHAEDDFENIQKNLLAARAQLSTAIGKDGALFDFFVQAMKIDQYVAANYEKNISEEFRAVLEGYAQGLNAYAANHPKEVLLKKGFPVKPEDIITGYMLPLTLFTGITGSLRDVFQNKMMDESQVPEPHSNGIALSSSKTKDGKTYFVLNPHNEFSGRFAWYEAHMVSDEGMDVHGALFPGAVSPMIGFNNDIAWMHTFSYHDMADVYKLEMHPTEKLKYKYDGQWLELEQVKYKIKVNLKIFKLAVGRKVYYSVHGPVLKNKHGYYAFRVNAHEEMRTAETWYRFGLAHNWEEFYGVLESDGIPVLNLLYADKDDNIFYLGNSKFPKRNPKYDYSKVLPGNTSDAVWNEVIPIKQRPQYLNPECGYVFNVNNTPLKCSCPEEHLLASNFSHIIGLQTFSSMRGSRFLELFAQYEREKMDLEDVKTIKYDLEYTDDNLFIIGLRKMMQVDFEKTDELQPLVNKILNWDLSTAGDNKDAAYVNLFLKEYFALSKQSDKYFFLNEDEANPEFVVKALLTAKEKMLKLYGSIDVAYNKHVFIERAGNKYPIEGSYDVPASLITRLEKDGKLKAVGGDCYMAFLKFGDNGLEYAQSVVPYGASNKPGSPHYDDQLEMYLAKDTKKVYRTRKEVEENAERIYHPR